MHVGCTCRPAYTAFFVSSKDFDGCNDAQHVFVDQIASVDVYEAIPVFVGVQIETQRPQRPEHSDVAVRQAGVIKIDEPAETPMVKDDVGKTIIAMHENIRVGSAAVRFDDMGYVFEIGVATRRGEE